MNSMNRNQADKIDTAAGKLEIELHPVGMHPEQASEVSNCKENWRADRQTIG